MNTHDGILHQIQEAKRTGSKDKLAEAVELLKETLEDLEAQERIDLTTVVLDIEDISSRI